ncbi:isoleucine--tRNA ligase [soil metagenome]
MKFTSGTRRRALEYEKDIIRYWKDNKTFEKSVDLRPKDNSYVFYDGPPFATGMPHYGHLLASTIKDVVPRYWTMKGYRVDRRWGWDCHGVPIENMIEKDLDLKGGKKGIEAYGIGRFNDACQAAIFKFDKEWEVIIRRLGRWVDFKNSYKTMDKNYMESVWWGFSQLYKKDSIYEGRKVLLYCPRCATPLSNFEIAMDNSYKDVEDNSVYVKFKVKKETPRSQALEKFAKNHQEHIALPEYLLAWTTTPWTLPGNVALAVLPNAEYSQIEMNDELLWMAKDKVTEMAKLHGIHHPEVLQTVTGECLLGLEYEPLYSYMPIGDKKAYYVTDADFVSLEEGTGIVHTAAIYGEDDYALALKKDLPTVPTLDDQGKFLDSVEPLKGVFYKKAEQWVMDDLIARNLMYQAEKYTHSYPFCYRCATPLFYNAVPAWFINVQKVKSKLLAANEEINWVPEHLKHGRFGKGIETAPDWNISRSRYWGTPMPIWKSASGEVRYRVISSIEELKKWAVDPEKVKNVDNIHRQYIDEIELWIDDEKTVKGRRIVEVFDCWVESASMPYAAQHYPFENKEWFEKNYPAQFISEYIAQTRAWFYCMHVMSVILFDKPSFQNALTTGTILAEDGAKMSKSKKNYPDPMVLIDKFGVDSLRLYLMSSVVMKADNLNFNEKEVDELRKKVFVIWWNLLSFYKQFVEGNIKAGHIDVTSLPEKTDHVMDQWLLSHLQLTITEVTTAMDKYDVVKASRSLVEFVNELSTWYLRQSRDRLKQNDAAGQQAAHVFGYVLVTLAQLFAPLTPFFSEISYQQLVGEKKSVHLTDWPTGSAVWYQEKLEKDMELATEIVTQAHKERQVKGFKLRQPLASVSIKTIKEQPSVAVTELILAEINMKKMEWEQYAEGEGSFVVSINTELTPELIAEGKARDIMRQVQQLRKDAGVGISDHVRVQLPDWPRDWTEQIQQKTKSTLEKGDTAQLLK